MGTQCVLLLVSSLLSTGLAYNDYDYDYEDDGDPEGSGIYCEDGLVLPLWPQTRRGYLSTGDRFARGLIFYQPSKFLFSSLPA